MKTQSNSHNTVLTHVKTNNKKSFYYNSNT